jgi:LPXTG-motif cell wall-anchored protein
VTSAQTVEVSARPDAPDFGFGEDVSNPELFTFVFTTPDAAGCAQLTTLALTGGGSTNGLLFAGALSLFAVGGMLSIRRRAARS